MSGIFSLGGMEDNTGAGNGGNGRGGAGWRGGVQALMLGESASQHAAVTRATVTYRPTAGARLTTGRTNYRLWERADNAIQPWTYVS